MERIDISAREVEKALDRVRSFSYGGEIAATFAALDELRTAVDALEFCYLDVLRESMTLTEIGAHLGITKEGAFRRYRRKRRAVE